MKMSNFTKNLLAVDTLNSVLKVEIENLQKTMGFCLFSNFSFYLNGGNNVKLLEKCRAVQSGISPYEIMEAIKNILETDNPSKVSDFSDVVAKVESEIVSLNIQNKEKLINRLNAGFFYNSISDDILEKTSNYIDNLDLDLYFKMLDYLKKNTENKVGEDILKRSKENIIKNKFFYPAVFHNEIVKFNQLDSNLLIDEDLKYLKID